MANEITNGINSGDSVRITTKDEIFEGIVMPRPKLYDENILVLKLKSGYNTGIDKKRITSIEVLKEYKQVAIPSKKIPFNPNLPTVVIISTGGTISSKVDYTTGGVVAKYDADDLIAMCPELSNIANIKTAPIMAKMSEDFTPKDWIEIAKEAKKHLDDDNISGVVITQGTDTMHFTTAALSFMLQELNKPVIVTGSQRSIDRPSSDAFMNLVCSVNAACNFEGVGVFLCMHATSSDDYCYLHLGTKVRKMHTLRRDSFRSINARPVAKVFIERNKIEILSDKYLMRPEEEKSAKIIAHFEKKTALLYVYPGIDENIIDFYKDNDFKGIVIAATALGHVPNNLIPKLKELIDKNIPVIISTQTLYGRVDPLVYTALRELSINLGCIFAEDMMPEVSYVKLGWILSQTRDVKEIAKLMHKNFAYEIDKNQDPSLFLN
jgi:glutamyl-tRNA(Gln) amidotransferase subunit D